MTKSPRLSPSVFAYCKRSNTGSWTWERPGNEASISPADLQVRFHTLHIANIYFTVYFSVIICGFSLRILMNYMKVTETLVHAWTVDTKSSSPIFVKCLETRLLGLVMHDLCTYCTLYYVCEITSGCNRGAELKQMESGSSSWSRCSQGAAAEVDTIGQQQLKRTQSGSSSWSGCNWEAAAEADAIGEQHLKQAKLFVWIMLTSVFTCTATAFSLHRSVEDANRLL